MWISSYNFDSTSQYIMGSKVCGYNIFYSRRLVWSTHWMVNQITWITCLYKYAHVDTIVCCVRQCTTLPNMTHFTCYIWTRSLWIMQDQDRCLYSRMSIIWTNWDQESMVNQTIQINKHENIIIKYCHWLGNGL
jgi:hypothetical protein